MIEIPNITITMRCLDCGHVQQATSCIAMKDEDGDSHYWFGSAFDFCDKCDGVVEEIPSD